MISRSKNAMSTNISSRVGGTDQPSAMAHGRDGGKTARAMNDTKTPAQISTRRRSLHLSSAPQNSQRQRARSLKHNNRRPQGNVRRQYGHSVMIGGSGVCVLFDVHCNGEVEDCARVLERDRDRVAAAELVAVAQHIGLNFRPELADEQQVRVVDDDRLQVVAVA